MEDRQPSWECWKNTMRLDEAIPPTAYQTTQRFLMWAAPEKQTPMPSSPIISPRLQPGSSIDGLTVGSSWRIAAARSTG